MSVDGIAAARTLLARGSCNPGLCLYYVWLAYKAHGAATDHPAVGTATEAWYASQGKHPGDRNPPAGVPVWWGPREGSAAGDVVISLGGGRVAATDWPSYGFIGETTIDARERQIGRPYLGWTERIFDAQISYPGSAGVAPLPLEAPVSYPILAGGHLYHIAPDFLKHFAESGAADLTVRIITADDKPIKLSVPEFLGQLDSFGIPRGVVDTTTGEVLDLDLGKRVRGGTWSRAREAAAKPSGDAELIVQRVLARVATALSGA